MTIFGLSINLYATFIILLFVLFIFIFWKAQKNNKLDWVDVITKDGRIVSLTKILQLIGGVIGTWIVVQMTLDGTITWEIFLIYLAYVASIEGFSKFVQAKYGPYGESQGKGGMIMGGGGYAGHHGGYQRYGAEQAPAQPIRKPATIDPAAQAEDNSDRLLSGGAKAQIDDE